VAAGRVNGESRNPKKLREPSYFMEKSFYQGGNKLKDYVALITGGSSGIGRAVACLYAREGADVAIIFDENDSDAQETKQLVKEEGRKCLLLKGDVSDKRFCFEAIKEVMNKFGRLDVLINGAAFICESPHLDELTEKQLLKSFRTNVFSVFFLTQAAIPYLEKSPNPSIINVTSDCTWHGTACTSDYTASKMAVEGFSISIASLLAERGIRVNTVAPGAICTPGICEALDRNTLELLGKNTMLGRPGQPDEVAPSFVFLAAPEASYITGQTIHINGGLYHY
jgi:NAD(P)-dependent dehydrogenase (short-subunit alcohol dehydrogenase family)